MLNLTISRSTRRQRNGGLEDPPEEYETDIQRLLTVDESATPKKLVRTAAELADVAREWSDNPEHPYSGQDVLIGEPEELTPYLEAALADVGLNPICEKERELVS